MARHAIVIDRAVEFRLTPSEQRVLVLLAEGLSTHLIANVLGVRDGTVRSHIESCSRKLGATGRTHAVVLALELGVLTVLDSES